LRGHRPEWRKWELFDAVAWDANDRATLVEYDTATRTWSEVLARVEAGLRLKIRQLWATPSPQRARNLASLCPDLEAWLIDWLDVDAYCVGSPDRPLGKPAKDGNTVGAGGAEAIVPAEVMGAPLFVYKRREVGRVFDPVTAVVAARVAGDLGRAVDEPDERLGRDEGEGAAQAATRHPTHPVTACYHEGSKRGPKSAHARLW
jgi:hypothetical protein